MAIKINKGNNKITKSIMMRSKKMYAMRCYSVKIVSEKYTNNHYFSQQVRGLSMLTTIFLNLSVDNV